MSTRKRYLHLGMKSICLQAYIAFRWSRILKNSRRFYETLEILASKVDLLASRQYNFHFQGWSLCIHISMTSILIKEVVITMCYDGKWMLVLHCLSIFVTIFFTEHVSKRIIHNNVRQGLHCPLSTQAKESQPHLGSTHRLAQEHAQYYSQSNNHK